MSDIAVVDYGMGNLRSVAKALEHVAPDVNIRITDSAQVIRNAARVVFPGQGAMPDCMRELDARNLRAAVVAAASSKPFLGICLGLQMLFDFSEEGNIAGLGLFAGKVEKFDARKMFDEQGNRLKVPHMGWNQVRQSTQHPLWQGVAQNSRFYFVHSYYVVPTDISIIAGESTYPYPFVCAVAKDNVFAVQFHPEKSQIAGLTLLSNFVLWEGGSALPKLRRVA
jgi:imidazole glycerol-phosphate synthase subunit HisH